MSGTKVREANRGVVGLKETDHLRRYGGDRSVADSSIPKVTPQRTTILLQQEGESKGTSEAGESLARRRSRRWSGSIQDVKPWFNPSWLKTRRPGFSSWGV
ncbi:MAG: hypothetical protein PVF83_14070 [Anaerolineales bacterium]